MDAYRDVRDGAASRSEVLDLFGRKFRVTVEEIPAPDMIS